MTCLLAVGETHHPELAPRCRHDEENYKCDDDDEHNENDDEHGENDEMMMMAMNSVNMMMMITMNMTTMMVLLKLVNRRQFGDDESHW